MAYLERLGLRVTDAVGETAGTIGAADIDVLGRGRGARYRLVTGIAWREQRGHRGESRVEQAVEMR